MGGLGNYLKQKTLSHAFNIAAMTQPGPLVVALMSTEPSDANVGGVEVTGTGYARATVGSWTWDAAADGVRNAVDVLFPLAGANNWTTANAVAVFDAASNLFGHAALLAAVTPLTGQQVRIPASALLLQFNP